MKTFKPLLLIFALIAITLTVKANKFENESQIKKTTPIHKSTQLPVNRDLVFALTAIVSLGGYIALKK